MSVGRKQDLIWDSFQEIKINCKKGCKISLPNKDSSRKALAAEAFLSADIPLHKLASEKYRIYLIIFRPHYLFELQEDSKFENSKIWCSCNIYQFIIKINDFKLVFVIKC